MNSCQTIVSQAPHVELHNVKIVVKTGILQAEYVPYLLRTFMVQVCLKRSGSREGSHFQLLRIYSLMVEVRILVKFRNATTLLNMRYMFRAS